MVEQQHAGADSLRPALTDAQLEVFNYAALMYREMGEEWRNLLGMSAVFVYAFGHLGEVKAASLRTLFPESVIYAYNSLPSPQVPNGDADAAALELFKDEGLTEQVLARRGHTQIIERPLYLPSITPEVREYLMDGGALLAISGNFSETLFRAQDEHGIPGESGVKAFSRFLNHSLFDCVLIDFTWGHNQSGSEKISMGQYETLDAVMLELARIEERGGNGWWFHWMVDNKVGLLSRAGTVFGGE